MLSLRIFSIPDVIMSAALENHVAERYGGFTQYNGYGGWIDQHTGERQDEEIAVMEILTDIDTHDEVWAYTKQLALDIAKSKDEIELIFTTQLISATFERTGV